MSALQTRDHTGLEVFSTVLGAVCSPRTSRAFRGATGLPLRQAPSRSPDVPGGEEAAPPAQRTPKTSDRSHSRSRPGAQPQFVHVKDVARGGSTCPVSQSQTWVALAAPRTHRPTQVAPEQTEEQCLLAITAKPGFNPGGSSDGFSCLCWVCGWASERPQGCHCLSLRPMGETALGSRRGTIHQIAFYSVKLR